jgi:hypothetical protein
VGRHSTIARPPARNNAKDRTASLAGGYRSTPCGAVRAATGGSIILLHDAGGDRSQTVAALPRILRTLLDRRHRPVRVDETARAG